MANQEIIEIEFKQSCKPFLNLEKLIRINEPGVIGASKRFHLPKVGKGRLKFLTTEDLSEELNEKENHFHYLIDQKLLSEKEKLGLLAVELDLSDLEPNIQPLLLCKICFRSNSFFARNSNRHYGHSKEAGASFYSFTTRIGNRYHGLPAPNLVAPVNPTLLQDLTLFFSTFQRLD